jgi:hypothetical protein
MSNNGYEDVNVGKAIASGASGAVAGWHLGLGATALTGGAAIVTMPLWVVAGYFLGVARSIKKQESTSALSAAGDVASVYDSFYHY